ncbi:MAG: IS607 family transposase [Candidatus Paceibacterota bacterium]
MIFSKFFIYVKGKILNCLKVERKKNKKKLASSSSSDNSIYIPPKSAIKQYGVSRTTLAAWARDGKIRSIRLGDGPTSGHRYNEQDLRIHLGIREGVDGGGSRRRLTILYARVSSQKQKESGDLDRQIELLKKEYPEADKVITDVASALNFKRKGLLTLLDLVEKGHVATVVVTYKDRLARFGVDLIERTIKKHGATLHVVQRQEDHDPSAPSELAEDLLAVCNYFVAKNNGLRAAALRRSRRSSESQDPQGSDEDSLSTSESSEDTPPRQKRPRSRTTQADTGHCSLDL